MCDSIAWENYLNQFDVSSHHFQNIPSHTEKYCVIIEPRKHKYLLRVIKNFTYLLQNKGWGLIIFHGTDNEDFLKQSLQNWNHVKYVNLQVTNLNIHQYNHILTTVPFWNFLRRLGCKNSLLFQTDTVLLKDNVDDFLHYDFIGAPWCVEWYNIKGGYNGGLSLRNVEKMIDIIQKSHPLFFENTMVHINEDIYFAYFMDKYRSECILPEHDVAKQFSVETVYYPDPIGMHQPHVSKFPSENDFERILSKRYEIE